MVEYRTVFGEMGSKPERAYYVIVAVDILVSLLLFGGGVGVLKRRGWAGSVASTALAASLTFCLGLLCGLWIPALGGVWGSLLLWILAPRFLYYLVTIVAAPYLLRRVVVDPAATPEDRRHRRRCMTASAILTALLAAFTIVLRQVK